MVSWLLCFAGVGAWIFLHSVAENSTFAEQSRAYISGQVIGLLAIAIGGAWLIFKVLKESQLAASIALPVIFAVLLSSAVKDVIKDIKAEKLAMQELEANINQAETPEEKLKLVEDMLSEIAPEFSPLIETVGTAGLPFAKSAEVLAGERFLNFETLAESVGPAEYEWQRAVAASHIAASEKYLTALRSSFEQIETLGDSSKDSEDFRAGFKEKLSLMVLSMEANVTLGGLYGGLFAHLESAQGKWRTEENANVFESDEVRARFEVLIEEIGRQEDVVNRLIDKIQAP